MYVHPDAQVNAALRDALFESAREISEHITFDFNNDGQFSHTYSDLSATIVDVDLERSTLKTDLPESVNTIQGFSSAELTLRLKGARNSDELSVGQLLSPFFIGGPFFNRNLTGTDIRYWKRVQTDFGPVNIRQFTGVIRDIQFDRTAQVVNIVCSDVMRWINSAVTLPHWAIDEFKIADWSQRSARPINSAWVVGEILRQCGTPIGPLERNDAFISASGMGSLLHSVGKRYAYEIMWNDFHKLPVTPVAPWEAGKYGPALKSVSGTGQARIQASNVISGSRTVYVPVNGTSNGPVNLGMNMWAKSNGNTTNRPHPTTNGNGAWYTDGAVMNLGLQVDPGVQNVNFNVGNNGQVFATLYMPGNNTIATWVWAYKPSGWHYYDLNWRFRNNSITPVLTVDGVVQTPLSSTTVSTGFVYPPNEAPVNNLNFPHLYLVVMDPAQHFQLYSGNDTAVYRPGQEHPPTTKDGRPWIDFGGCLAELSFIPDVWNESAWDVLQRIASAEFAGIYTNEWGQLVWKPHIALRELAMYDAVERYTVDNILGMIVNPSLDQYKNEVNVAYVDRTQAPALIFSPDGWQTFNVPTTGTVLGFGPYLIDDVVDMPSVLRYGSGFRDTPSSIDFMKYSRFSATYTNNLTLDGWEQSPGLPGETPIPANVWVDLSDDQRSFTLTMRVSPDGRTPGLWMGTRAIEGNETEVDIGMEVWGKKYTDKTTGWYRAQNVSEVAEFGRYALILEEDDWRQTYATAAAIAPELLADTINPAPVITGLSIPSDPRLWIGDTINLVSGDGITGQVKAQIVGIRRGAKSAMDSLDVRIVVSPSTWILGQAGASELGTTTILGD